MAQYPPYFFSYCALLYTQAKLLYVVTAQFPETLDKMHAPWDVLSAHGNNH